MDNAPWHKKAKRLIESEKEYADIRKAITIVSLPPYSPDLNPIEQVWRVTRREKTHNRFWKNLEALVNMASISLRLERQGKKVKMEVENSVDEMESPLFSRMFECFS